MYRRPPPSPHRGRQDSIQSRRTPSANRPGESRLIPLHTYMVADLLHAIHLRKLRITHPCLASPPIETVTYQTSRLTAFIGPPKLAPPPHIYTLSSITYRKKVWEGPRQIFTVIVLGTSNCFEKWRGDGWLEKVHPFFFFLPPPPPPPPPAISKSLSPSPLQITW